MKRRRGGGRPGSSEAVTSLVTHTSLDPVPPGAMSPVRITESLPSLETGQRVAGRYVVEALLGRGGFGEVYEVRDEARGGARVAMKLHRIDVHGEHAALALRAEFALLSTLRHPNLAQVHDFGYLEHEVAYFTQPIVSGVALDQLGLALDSKRAVRLVAQLCRALEYLHARGILHRDVKPSNVLVDPETDRVTLLDFGVSRATRDPDRMLLAGTHAYLAPEVITGGAVDARSDLYSLGVTLYRVATGHLPFQGSASEILAAHVLERPPPLPDGLVAQPVADVVHRLLAKDPAHRFASASQVIEALVAATGARVQTETSDTLASWVLSAEFVADRDLVGELVSRAAELGGTIGPILVTGEAGTGKSRFLREVRSRVQVAGEGWIEVEASPREGGGQLVQSIARAVLSRLVVRQLADDDRLELARALPELRRRGERIAVAMDPERARRSRLSALARAMRVRFGRRPGSQSTAIRERATEPPAAASTAGGVLAIEDLHWASEATIATLRELIAAMRAVEVPCLVVLTARPGIAAGVVAELGGEQVPLEALSAEQSARLVESIFGQPGLLAGTELGRALDSGPHSGLWVHESLRLAIDRGAIVRRGAEAQSWAVVRDVPALPLGDVLAERVALLSPTARSAALALAVLVEPSTRAEIATTSGLAPRAVGAAMDALVRGGIAEARRDRAGRVRYAMHARFGAPVKALFDERAIGETEGRAGRLLAARGRDDRDLLDRAAFHLVRAGDVAAAVRAWWRAADLADRGGRPDLAVRSIDRISAVVPLDDRARLMRHDLAVRGAMADEARATLAELERRAPRAGRRERVEISLRRAQAAHIRGEGRRARTTARAALAGARRLRDRGLVARVLVLFADLEREHGQLRDAHDGFREAAALAAKARDRATEARAWLGALLTAIYLGEKDVAYQHAHRAVRAARVARDRTLEAEGLRALGNVARDRGETGAALRWYRSAVRIAREGGSNDAEAKALNNIGIMAQWAGRLVESAEAFRRAIWLKEQLGATTSLAISHNNLGALLIGMGRLADAKQHLELARAALTDSTLVVASVAEGNCADAYALEGRLDEAIAGFRSSLRTSLDRGMVEQQPHAATGLARALLMKDPTQRDEVAELAELLDRLASSGDVDTRRRALTTRAMLAAVRGQDDRMLDLARQAMRLGDRVRHQAGAFATPLEAHWIGALAARRLGDEAEAALMRGRALSLLARVARALPSPTERSSLHHGHPIHRAVLAGEWSPPPGWTWDPA